jgi:hypothetical protein
VRLLGLHPSKTLLQEIKTRLLDPYEKSAPEHHWLEWYAAYMTAREGGSTSEEASKAAGLYMEGAGYPLTGPPR